MVPGKKYKAEDMLQVARRRKALLVVPFLLTVVITAGASQLLPNRYRSSTSILIVPQRIPESYIKSTVTTRMEERLQTISQQILSRTRLERIIQDFNLYAKERKTGLMEDIVEQMRKDILVTILKATTAFQVSYTCDDARTAMRVTERLASLFIEENLRDREVLVEGTNQFLETQLEDARRRLVEHERKLEEFNRQHAGELPSQLQSNTQMLQNLQLQIQAVGESFNRDRDRRAFLERIIADLSAPVATPGSADAVPAADADPARVEGATATLQLEIARANLRGLELRLRPEHPDIGRLTRAIRELEKKAEAEALQRPLSPDAPALAGLSQAEIARLTRVRATQFELAMLDRQMATKVQQDRQLRERMALYQARVEATPRRESEMIALSRDYETLKDIYTNLLEKHENAKVAANLERRQIGEQFKILDPARLPERPISPNRIQINIFGALLGLALGIGLVALLEYRDSSMRTDEDVLLSLALPVLAIIPVMTTTIERRKRHRRRLALAAAVGVIVVAGSGALVWKLVL